MNTCWRKYCLQYQKGERDATSYDSFSVGLHLQSQGITAHHPVIMIPGVISTGLESWSTGPDSRQYFRKRLWGSWSMMRALVLDQAAWKRHIMLDKHTGLDPPGIKLRAAQGFDATDFFITGYWIWNKIVENLATIGYDPSNSFTAAYDWRLTYMNLEIRDSYFTRLKNYIEVAHKTSGIKPILVSHSMGYVFQSAMGDKSYDQMIAGLTGLQGPSIILFHEMGGAQRPRQRGPILGQRPHRGVDQHFGIHAGRCQRCPSCTLR